MEHDAHPSAREDLTMTMPEERTRALLWAGGFLIELARDKSLPVDIRRQAVIIARHFPTIEDVSALAMSIRPSALSIELALPSQISSQTEIGRFGPLRHATRLSLPD